MPYVLTFVHTDSQYATDDEADAGRRGRGRHGRHGAVRRLNGLRAVLPVDRSRRIFYSTEQ